MELRPKYVRIALSLVALCGLVVVTSSAQEVHGWTSSTGSVSAFLGAGQVNPVAVEVDANGNIYTAGRVNNSADFDPSPSTTYTLTPSGSSFTGFVTKLNSEGELVWAGLFNTSGASQVTDISIDSSGNVLVVGHFSGTADLDPSAGTLSVQSSSSGAQTNLFLVRLTPTGSVTWSHTLPVLSYAYSADVDAANNFVVTGEFA
ncbi:MAG: Bifunctional hemolysin/adenylate cyclase precursor, partial [Actinomycetota bacterium]